MRGLRLTLLLTSALLLLSACDPSAGGIHDLFNPPPGPELTIASPAAVTAGQPAHFVFSWSGGEAPYAIEVTITPARIENGVEILQGDATPIVWSSSAVSSGVSHDFTLPALSGEFNLYDLTAMVSDKHYDPGSGGLGGGFIPGYQSSDFASVVFGLTP